MGRRRNDVPFYADQFADKAVIGLAAVPIIAYLHLTNEQFGQVGSAFFLFFSLSAVLVGFLVNRVSTKWVLTAMALVWAFTQLPMLGAVSLPILFASRIVLGAGERPAYPVALHAVYKWFPNERRTVPTSLVSIGGPLGVGVVAPLLTWIILTFSWHAGRGPYGRRAACADARDGLNCCCGILVFRDINVRDHVKIRPSLWLLN